MPHLDPVRSVIYKFRARELFNELKAMVTSFKIGFIDSSLTQTQRDEMINLFCCGQISALITTEVLARGTDFIGVNCVINFGALSDNSI